MADYPQPPKNFLSFVERFPQLAEAWETIGRAGQDGPLDERTGRLVKLGAAIGSMREGAVHAGVRKALALGITPEEIEQIVALSSSLIGMPGAAAAFSWVRDELDKGAA